MTRYRAIHCKIWNHRPFVDDDTLLVMFHLLTSQQGNKIGLFRASMKMLAAEMEWDVDRYVGAFEGLPEGFAFYDTSTKLIYLPGFILHNPPNNPNVLKGWAGEFDEISHCELRKMWFENMEKHSAEMGPSFSSAFKKAFLLTEKAFPLVGKSRITVSSSTRKRVLQRDGRICKICRRTEFADYEFQIDHIVPVSKGGDNNDNNLQVLCYVCNARKSADLPGEKGFRRDEKGFPATEKGFQHQNLNRNPNDQTHQGGEQSSKDDKDLDTDVELGNDTQVEVSNGQDDKFGKSKDSISIIALLRELWPELNDEKAEQYYMRIRSGRRDLGAEKLEEIIRKAWSKWPVDRSIYEGSGIGVWIVREIDMVLNDDKRESERAALVESRRSERNGTAPGKPNVHAGLQRLERDLIAGRDKGAQVIVDMARTQQIIVEAVGDGIALPSVVSRWLDSGGKSGAFELGPNRKLESFYRTSGTPRELIATPPPPMSEEEVMAQIAKAKKLIGANAPPEAPESTESPGDDDATEASDEMDPETKRILEGARDRDRGRTSGATSDLSSVGETLGSALDASTGGKKQ